MPQLRGRHVHLVHLPESVQAQIFVGNHAITRKHPDWLRLGLANSIYGGAFNSRLVMNIREDKGYTYSPRSGVHALRQHGYFSIHAAVRNEVVAATLTEMFYEMDRMRALPVGDAELADARNYLSGIFSLGLATQDGLAGQLSSVYLERLPQDYLETYRERIRALTAADVLAAARAHFDSANAQIVIVGDRAQHRRAGRAVRRSYRVRRAGELKCPANPAANNRQARIAMRPATRGAKMICGSCAATRAAGNSRFPYFFWDLCC